jgi:hypothetical protein
MNGKSGVDVSVSMKLCLYEVSATPLICQAVFSNVLTVKPLT